jgi:hypothetical protein
VIRYNVGLTLAEAVMIDDALRLLQEAQPDGSEASRTLRMRIRESIERQRNKKPKPKPKRKSKLPPIKSTDAMHRRLPGSFESGQR